MKQTDNDVGGMTATSFAALIDVKAVFTAYSNAELSAELTLNFNEKWIDGNSIATEGTATAVGGTNADRRGGAFLADWPTTGTPASPTLVVPDYNSGLPYNVDANKNSVVAPGGFAQDPAGWAVAYSMNFGKPSYWDIAKVDNSGANPALGDWNDNYNGPTNPSPGWAAGAAPAPFTTRGVTVVPTYPNTNVFYRAFGECDNARNNGRERQVTIWYAPPWNCADAGVLTEVAPRATRISVAWTGIHSR
jgi:hypothetical protein